MRFISGGVDAKVVMGGIGSSAKQVWPSLPNVERTVTLAISNDFEKLSYQGFDGRSEVLTSHLNQGVVNNGKFTPEPNDAPTYEYRALDQIFDGAATAIQTVISANPTPLAVPSILVLSVKTGNAPELVGVEYGSDGVRIISLVDATIIYEYRIPFNLVAGATLRVERFLSWIQVYVNDIRIGVTTHESFRLIGTPGIGVYSSPTALSTPVGPTKFFGGSSFPKTSGGMNYVGINNILPTGRSVEIMAMQVEGGRAMKAIARNILWRSNTLDDDEDRYIRVLVNGSQVARNTNSRGVTYWETAAFQVPENAIVSVTGYVSTGATLSNKMFRSGSLEVIPAT